MKKSSFLFRTFEIITLVASLLFLGACSDNVQNIRLGSGNKGGFYDSFADTFVNLVNRTNYGFKIQKKNTAGSSANIRLLEEGFIDLGIVQADILKDYLERTRMNSAIAAIAGLYTESIQIVVATDSDIHGVADLAGKRVSIGEDESGVIRNAEIILEAYGITFENIRKENLSFEDAATALKEGTIDAFFCTAGIPTPSISKLSTAKEIRILSLDNQEMERITSLHPELTDSNIPAGTYNGQDSTTHTLGVKAILVASQMLDSAIVNQITREVFTPGNQQVTHIPVGFHPGAAAFYKSLDINVNAVSSLPGRAPIPSTGD